jgi:hypothetical protein
MRLLSVLATLAALVVLGCGGGSTSPNGTSSAASHSGCLGQPDDDMPATINEIEMYDLQSKFIKGSGNMKVVVKRAKVSIARVKARRPERPVRQREGEGRTREEHRDHQVRHASAARSLLPDTERWLRDLLVR